ncbi:MAG TPA: carbohydrate ABC transporter permease [Propylenella sp.]
MALLKRRRKSRNIMVNIAVIVLVTIWTVPTLGLLVSSLRDKDLISISGWWTALVTTESNLIGRAAPPSDQVEAGGRYVIAGNLFSEGTTGVITRFGARIQNPTEFAAGETATLPDGARLTIAEDGSYELSADAPFEGAAGRRLFYTAALPPRFTFDNYRNVMAAEGIGQSFINSLTVTIPSTVIPILIAAYAAYALAWMKFPARALLLAVVVGLLVVPLQMSLIPLLRLYNGVGAFVGVPAKTYLGIWLAHTAFGLPLAIYLLRNYIAGLPHEIMESARIDGASDFDIFVRIVLPLSLPALAAFSIFQFLWVWNDLLVAMVFLGNTEEQLVLTGRLRELLGSRGGNWEILTASAFVTIVIPLIVFFALQRFLVRGLLAGSVKG